jgi:hypothetical protein
MSILTRARSTNNLNSTRTVSSNKSANSFARQASSAPNPDVRRQLTIEAKKAHAQNGAAGVSEVSGDTHPDRVQKNLDESNQAAKEVNQSLEIGDSQGVQNAVQKGRNLGSTNEGKSVTDSTRIIADDMGKNLGLDPNDLRRKKYESLSKAYDDALANQDLTTADRLKPQMDQAFKDWENNLPTSTKNKLKEAFGDNYKNMLKFIALAGAGLGLYFLAKAWSDEYDGCYKRTLGKDSVKLDCFDKSKKDYCSCDGTWDRSKPVSGQCSGNNANYPSCACGAGSNPLCSQDLSADGSITYIWRDVGLAEGLGRALGDAVSNGILNPGADVLSNFFDKLGLGSAFKYILIGIGVLILVIFLVKFGFRMMDGGGRSRSSDFSFSFYSNS